MDWKGEKAKSTSTKLEVRPPISSTLIIAITVVAAVALKPWLFQDCASSREKLAEKKKQNGVHEKIRSNVRLG